MQSVTSVLSKYNPTFSDDDLNTGSKSMDREAHQ